MTDSQREQRRTALAWSGGVCEVCGKKTHRGDTVHHVSQVGTMTTIALKKEKEKE